MSRNKKTPAPRVKEPDTQSIFYMLEHGEPAPAPVRQLDLFAGVACADADACPPTQKQCVQCGALFTAGGGFCPACVAEYRATAPKRQPPTLGEVDELAQFHCERCGYVETGVGPLCRGCEREDEGKEAAE